MWVTSWRSCRRPSRRFLDTWHIYERPGWSPSENLDSGVTTLSRLPRLLSIVSCWNVWRSASAKYPNFKPTPGAQRKSENRAVAVRHREIEIAGAVSIAAPAPKAPSIIRRITSNLPPGLDRLGVGIARVDAWQVGRQAPSVGPLSPRLRRRIRQGKIRDND